MNRRQIGAYSNSAKRELANMKPKRNILTIAALLIASATFVACSSEDEIAEQPIQNPTQPQVYTMTVQATKGNVATTRALSLDDQTLNATWATTENVYVYKVEYNEKVWATGSLQPDADGADATLKGELSGIGIQYNTVLHLQFPRSGEFDYTGQVGTLEDIAAKYDYATATVTVDNVSATGNITAKQSANFENQQAIVKFTLIDNADGTTPINATRLVVSDGTNRYTINPASATNVLYVAIPGFSGQTVTLAAATAATDGTDFYTYQKTNVTFTNGQYYDIKVKMTKDEQNIHLELLNKNLVAVNGATLTGTLNDKVMISVDFGATVTLNGVTINGKHSGNDDYYWAGITCLGNATIVLAEGTTNTVKGFQHTNPGIQVPEESTLTIKGNGSLNASSNGYGAGIGAAQNTPCGNIVIEGGNITATGGDTAAGIGGSKYGEIVPEGGKKIWGDITIKGGTINATGGNGAPGIGAGSGWDNVYCGNILIEGGTITATGGNGAPGIGGSYLGGCGNITITRGVTKVEATKGGSAFQGYDDKAPHNIGMGYHSPTCGKVTILGTEYMTGGSYNRSTQQYSITYQPNGENTLTADHITITPNN